MIDNLSPYPAYKPSGVEWLGEVPEDWGVERTRWLFRERDERSDTGREDLLTVSHLTGVTLRSEKEVNMFEAETKEGYKRCSFGDLVINTLWAWMGAMGIARTDGIVSPAYHVYQTLDNLDPEYLDSIVRLPLFAQEVKRYSKGVWSSRLRLYPEGFFEVCLSVPPASEQRDIVRFLDYADRRIRRYIRAKEKLITLLKEQKQAIIHEAVTGQIDVRTGQPYSAYKESGVEWLGDVPEHWVVHRLRNTAEMRVSNVDKHVKDDELPVLLCNYIDVYSRDYIDSKIDFMRATATSDEIERFRLIKGDVLITKDSEAWDDIGVPALVSETAEDLISGYHLALLRPLGDIVSGGYLLRVLQSKGVAYQFHIEAKGVTRYGLSYSGIKSVVLPLPPLTEQASIVRFLDKTAENIDTAISHAEQEIDLLTEYRTRLIADVVTGKLDVREAAAKLPEADHLSDDAVENARDVDGPPESGNTAESAEVTD